VEENRIAEPEEVINIKYMDKLMSETWRDVYSQIIVSVEIIDKNGSRYCGETEQTDFELDANGSFRIKFK
jgi:hypothetical protein